MFHILRISSNLSLASHVEVPKVTWREVSGAGSPETLEREAPGKGKRAALRIAPKRAYINQVVIA